MSISAIWRSRQCLLDTYYVCTTAAPLRGASHESTMRLPVVRLLRKKERSVLIVLGGTPYLLSVSWLAHNKQRGGLWYSTWSKGSNVPRAVPQQGLKYSGRNRLFANSCGVATRSTLGAPSAGFAVRQIIMHSHALRSITFDAYMTSGLPPLLSP